MGSTVFPAPSAVRQTKIQEFTSSGTWTVPAGVYGVEVEIAGAGGAGGGVNATAN
jgi:hypothetical protein